MFLVLAQLKWTQTTSNKLHRTLQISSQCPLINRGQAADSNQAAQLILLVLLDSHNVLVVPALDPVTSTAMYFPF